MNYPPGRRTHLLPSDVHIWKGLLLLGTQVFFYSSQADKLGLPPLAVHKADMALSFARTLTHFPFLLPRAASAAIVGKTQRGASTLDIYSRR